MTYTKKLATAGVALVAWLAIPVAAGAQQVDPYTRVKGNEVGRQQLQQDPKVLGSEVSSGSDSSSSDTLPVTGGDLLGLTAIGLGAVGVGSVFVRRSRRTT
ncbi:MAG: LPXTG cell wall anchor domain-containing protein [Actinobacteria bacterium]|nr:LPXTG cell wall anchor domain-containing protein [Actinomycetota bacterium]